MWYEKKTNLALIESLKQFLLVEVVPLEYKQSTSDFTRNRKLPFPRLVTFMLKALRKKIGLEINSFYERLVSIALEEEQISLSSSAFCQGRQKLKPEFFRDGLYHLVKEYYTDNDGNIKNWHGKRLLAVDGSIIELPHTQALEQEYGTYANQHHTLRVNAKISTLYDVLNEIVLDGLLGKYKDGERDLALLHLSHTKQNDLLLYDRGYASFDFIFEHQQRATDFLMRVKVGWSNQVKTFVASGLDSQQIDLRVAKNEPIKDKLYNHQTVISVRFVRVTLPTGEIEVLITSLLDEMEYPSSIFKWLYFQRWKIETRYDILKNVLRLENFSGLSETVILQDFYIILLIANIEAILRDEVNQEIKKIKVGCQYEYKVNISACVSLLRDKIVDLLLGQEPQKMLNYLSKVFANHLEPIRPDRSFIRKNDHYRTKKKPKMFKNRKVNS